MRNQYRLSILLLCFCMFILNSCDSSTISEPNNAIPGLCSTYAVQTMVANPDLIFLISTSTPIPITCTPTQFESNSSPVLFTNVPTHTPIPTNTLVPSLTPYLTQTDTFGLWSASGECINAAEFVQDVTIPDDSIIKPKQEFTKIWRLRNIGSCIWTTNYALVLVGGDQLKGISPKLLDTPVDPGQTVDISIDLVAPKEPNYYQGNWMLRDESGNNFGTGSDAGNPIWVSIKVYMAGWRDVFQSFGGGGNRGKGGISGCVGGG